MMGGNNMGDINYKTMSTATRMAQTPNVLLQHTFFLTKLCNLPSDGLQRHSGGSKHEHITDRDVSFTFVCLRECSGKRWPSTSHSIPLKECEMRAHKTSCPYNIHTLAAL